MRVIHGLGLILLLLCSNLALAGETLSHSFSWIDMQGKLRRMQIPMTQDMLHQAYLSGRDTLDSEGVSQLIFDEAVALTHSMSTPGYSVRIEGKSLQNFTVTSSHYKGFEEQALEAQNDLIAFIEEAFDPVSDATYFYLDKERRRVRVHYNKIAQDHKPIVMKTILEISRITGTQEPEDLAKEVLLFLQQITYSDLEDDDISFFNPSRMMAEGKGDCESKQVFMASTLKFLFPERRVDLVELFDQEHIVLAMEDGQDWIFMDATGPGTSAWGELSDSTHFNDEHERYEVHF